jgi:hypothetical protein
MKKFADQKRTERHFNVGDWNYLRLQPYSQISLAHSTHPKLSSHYYGPFEIEERVGKVAYRFRLPADIAIHPVLQVSQLKQHLSKGQVVPPTLLISSSDGQLKVYPRKILDCRTIKWGNIAVPQILLTWTNLPPKDASWEDYDDIASRFP